MSKINDKDKLPMQGETKIKQFLEELSWVLSSHSTLDFKALPRLLKSILDRPETSLQSVGRHVSSNPNKQFLVGVLPRLFVDENLFPANDDIADFARTVMHVDIPRYHKKSRYELIGHIVCQTDGLNDEKLKDLVRALEVLTNRTDAVLNVKAKRRQGQFGWNEIIQGLVSESANEPLT